VRALLRDAGCQFASGESFLSTENDDFSDMALFGVETPRLNETSPKRIDVLLSSGGVRVLAFAGALRALQRNGYEIEHICGVSGGAVLAASFAARVDSDALVALARSGELSGRLRPPNRFEKLRALVPRSPPRDRSGTISTSECSAARPPLGS
jgi:predicted acylesterase/phospholipase RssA